MGLRFKISTNHGCAHDRSIDRMDGKDLPITRTPRRAAPQKNESESAMNPPKFAFRLPPKFQISPTPHPVIVALGPELDPLLTRPTPRGPIRSKSLFQTFISCNRCRYSPPGHLHSCPNEIHRRSSFARLLKSTCPYRLPLIRQQPFILSFPICFSLSLYSNPQNPR